MSKQNLVVVIGAIALLGLGVFGAIAFTGTSSNPAPSGQVTTGGTHTMDDGQLMTGTEMAP